MVFEREEKAVNDYNQDIKFGITDNIDFLK